MTSLTYNAGFSTTWPAGSTARWLFDLHFPDPDDGSSGVREPRRPSPPLPHSALALPLPALSSSTA